MKFSKNLSKTNTKSGPQFAAARRQDGFLSVELGLVLLVVAITVVGAVTYYSSNLRKTSISANIQQIQSIVGAAKASYGIQNRYSQVTTAVAVQSRIIPESLRDGTATTATNNFGSAITVASGNGTGTADMLLLNWGNVPASQCADIVLGTESSLRRVSVAGTIVKPLDSELAIATLNTACETNSNTGNVALILAIGRS
jgi:type II secretory pathway pseudopilin PulG